MADVTYAVVDFCTKAADGTMPCEIVPMSWISEDLKTCFWPGSKNYTKAFKQVLSPKSDWKPQAALVKFFSTDLEAVAKRRDQLINDGSANSAQDSEYQVGAGVLHNTRKRKTPSMLKVMSPCPSDTDLSDATSEPQSQMDKRKRQNLPSPPQVSTALFELVRKSNCETPNNCERRETAGKDPDILVVDINKPTSSLSSKYTQPGYEICGDGPRRRVTGMDKVLLQRMERIERKIDDLADFLKRQKTLQLPIVEKPETCPELPVSEASNVSYFNAYVSLEENFNAMVPFLMKTGGNGEKEATERVMAEIMCDKVAAQFNWKGRVRKDQPKKTGFQKFGSIVRLVQKTVKSMEKGANDKGIESAIRYWLKHAKRRIPKCGEPISDPSSDEDDAVHTAN